MKDNTYVVYLHVKEGTDDVFYVGISVGKRRPYYISDRSDFWKSVYNKHGREVRIINKGLSESDALDIEMELIKCFGRRDLGTGQLVNMTDGGELNKNRIPWNKGIKTKDLQRFNLTNLHNSRNHKVMDSITKKTYTSKRKMSLDVWGYYGGDTVKKMKGRAILL